MSEESLLRSRAERAARVAAGVQIAQAATPPLYLGATAAGNVVSVTPTASPPQAPPAATTAPQTHPWQFYASTGTATNQALKFRVRRSDVYGLNGQRFEPASGNVEFTAPANCPNGYSVWLDVSLNTGDGSIVAVDWGQGTSPPGSGAALPANTYPAHVYPRLGYVTTNATGIDDFDNSSFTTPISVVPVGGVIVITPPGGGGSASQS